MPDRTRLSSRRATYTFKLHFYGETFHISVGLDPSDAPAEVFVSGSKAGAAVQAISRDAAILTSLALQYGCPLEVMQKAMTREDKGEASSLVGAMIDAVIKEETQG